MNKLPYIKDKKMYAAVMGACSYVKSTGWFNKATQYYADKYSVDVEEVKRYVRIAQGNGQKCSKIKRRYFWFAVEYSIGNERNGEAYFEPLIAQYECVKGLTKETVMARISKNDDYKSEYAPCHWFGRIERFETQEQAQTKIQEWRKGI